MALASSKATRSSGLSSISGKRLADSTVMRSSKANSSSSSWKWVTSLFYTSSKSDRPAASLPAAAKLQQQQQQHVIDWHFNKPEMIRVQGMSMHYTSLRDIMLQLNNQQQQEAIAAITSPMTRTRMKNRLVEQAARAYLQPSTVENRPNQFFPWNWQKLMGSTPLTFTFSSTNVVNPAGATTRHSSMSFFSRALRYLLGRVRPQPIRFLQPGICV